MGLGGLIMEESGLQDSGYKGNMVIIVSNIFKFNMPKVQGVLFYLNEETRVISIQNWCLTDFPTSDTGTYNHVVSYLTDQAFVFPQGADDYRFKLTPEGYFRLKMMLVDGSVTITI
jgi:hypothetical protein